MAYRRSQTISKASMLNEDIHRSNSVDDTTTTTTTTSAVAPPSPVAAEAIGASVTHRDSSDDRSKGSATYDYTSTGSTNEPRGFWGVIARKAKSIIDDDNAPPPSFDTPSTIKTETVSTSNRVEHRYESFEHSRNMDGPKLRKGLDKLTSSLNQIGGTIGNAFEEGRTIVDKKTQDIIQETRKLQNRRKGMNDEQDQLQEPKMQSTQQQTNLTNQLKASRDVANATAAKAKLLLRELKTVKADLAFAKERSSQLEEENKMLREALEKGDRPTDDDMIRLQLELLLAEKARLANENSVYARENRFLREIVEYHQLSIQDVVYLDEGIEEVTEVNPELSRTLSTASSSPPSLHSSPHEPLERTTS
ncbi:hypothetical protein HanXRQr2_Chr15g0672331 [Helianthus annuus]|nr:uncharacterized protein LOC110909979 [Helianthus annuus]KAF5762737.1 hypothetical protein HanXRQr2_Chr15g0672331 [Helianthus annuus]KAJ0453556.1 hypothetical protein HanIR_Chr15g0730641 [Helianthus annuus]